MEPIRRKGRALRSSLPRCQVKGWANVMDHASDNELVDMEIRIFPRLETGCPVKLTLSEE